MPERIVNLKCDICFNTFTVMANEDETQEDKEFEHSCSRCGEIRCPHCELRHDCISALPKEEKDG